MASTAWLSTLLLPKHLQIEKDLIPITCLSVSNRGCVIHVKDSKEKRSVLKVGPQTGPLANEVSCLEQLNHPNIVKILSSFTSENVQFAQLEKIEGMALINVLNYEGRIQEAKMKSIFFQICSALAYLHSQGWVHRDIKPDNMVYDRRTGVCKLIDFDLATHYSLHSKLTESAGTPEYSSPELLRRNYVGPEIDVWALGVSLFTLLAGKFPFAKPSLFELSQPLEFPQHLSPECKDLIEQMLCLDPENRITMEEILQHNWLQPKERVEHERS